MISLLFTNFEREESGILPYVFSSFTQQTEKNFELVIADNGSSDNSVQIMRDLIKIYNLNGRVIEVPALNWGTGNINNGGSGKAINYGIQFCQGDVIILGHTDFYLHPNAVRLLSENLNESIITMPCTYWLHDLDGKTMDLVHETMRERLNGGQHEGGWEHLISTPGFFDWPLQGWTPPSGPVACNIYHERISATECTTFHIAGMTRNTFNRMRPFPEYGSDHGQIDGWFTFRSGSLGISFRRFPKPILIHLHHARRLH